MCCWNGGSRDQGWGWGCGVGSLEEEAEGERAGPHFQEFICWVPSWSAKDWEKGTVGRILWGVLAW